MRGCLPWYPPRTKFHSPCPFPDQNSTQFANFLAEIWPFLLQYILTFITFFFLKFIHFSFHIGSYLPLLFYFYSPCLFFLVSCSILSVLPNHTLEIFVYLWLRIRIMNCHYFLPTFVPRVNFPILNTEKALPYLCKKNLSKHYILCLPISEKYHKELTQTQQIVFCLSKCVLKLPKILSSKRTWNKHMQKLKWKKRNAKNWSIYPKIVYNVNQYFHQENEFFVCSFLLKCKFF